MKYSKLFGRTRYQVPHDAASRNAQLLTQAGFVEQLSAGIYVLLPLGVRVHEKIKNIIREEMNAIDSQELSYTALMPVDLWETTGRDQTMDDILYRTKGASGKDFVFGPSHEEAATPVAAKFVQSYKDLPFSVYQIQTKFRNEPRAKSGLLRGREFTMKDMYSFHRSEEDLDAYYERAIEAYSRVYERCGLKAYVVEASGGAFSDKFSHEFSVETDAGEDVIIVNKTTGKAQNTEVASGKIHNPADDTEAELPLEEVPMKRGTSIKANAEAHNVSAHKILKSVVYKVEDGFIGVCIRGDLQVNEHKLTHYLQKRCRPATAEELKELGLVQGFISPIQQDTIPFIADHSVKHVKNYVTGANKLNVDFVNANLGRDFTVKDFADLVVFDENALCESGDFEVKKVIEAGNIFKLGTIYSEAFKLMFTDEDGKQKPVVMGCYGIGTTRLMGTIVEASSDENGIIWPASVAPFDVHLVSIGDDEDVMKAAEDLYKKLQDQGIDVLFDERNESAGKKLKDADLIGVPVRLVVSKRTLAEQKVEYKKRGEKEAELVSLTDIIAQCKP